MTELANLFDSSFYFYDLDGLDNRLKQIQSHTFDGLKLWYATKANPLSSIIKMIRANGFGIDVASQGELEQALLQGYQGPNILSTGPSKSRKYLKSLLKHKIGTVVCESLNQVKWLNQAAKELKEQNELSALPQVLLRVQLDWQEGQSVLGGNEITPFGVDPSGWHELEKQDYQYLNIKGFHVFQWGNILDVSRLNEIWMSIAEQTLLLAQSLQLKCEVLDLGGGLGIPYTDQEQAIQFADIANCLKMVKEQFQIKEIWMELGRYLVGECGYYLTQVIDRKTVRGKEILVTDGGINHLARPALTDQPFPCFPLGANDEQDLQASASTQEFTVHGPLCTALDRLGTFELPSNLTMGDWIVFSQAGAYGMTEAMPYFLCHNLPAEVILKNKKTQIIRPIETSAKWLL